VEVVGTAWQWVWYSLLAYLCQIKTDDDEVTRTDAVV